MSRSIFRLPVVGPAFAGAAAFFLLAAAASAGDLVPRDSLTVVDANGKKVAPALTVGGGNVVGVTMGFNVDELLLVVQFSGFAPNLLTGRVEPMVYTTEDCSGTPYIVQLGYSLLAPAIAIEDPGNTVYVPEGDVVRITARSAKSIINRLDGTPARRGCGPLAPPEAYINLPVYRAAPVFDFNDYFTPPFSLR